MQQRIAQVYTYTKEALNELYVKRKRTLFFQKLIWGLAGLFFLLMLFNILSSYFPFLRIEKLPYINAVNNPYANLYPFIALVLILYPFTLVFAKAFRSYKTREASTIKLMVTSLFSNVRFSQNGMAPFNEVKASKLFSWIEQTTMLYSYGQLESTHNGTTLNIVDIGFVEENASRKILGGLAQIPGVNMLVVIYQFAIKNIFTSKIVDNTNYTYRGLFCWSSFKKSLKGHTVILTNNQTTRFNRYFSSNFKDEERVHIEDPRFADQFVVYSTDQVEARYIITTSLMERIVALKKKFNQPIWLSFKNKQFFLAVENKHGLFSFPGGTIGSIEVLEVLVADIQTTLEVPNALNLV